MNYKPTLLSLLIMSSFIQSQEKPTAKLRPEKLKLLIKRQALINKKCDLKCNLGDKCCIHPEDNGDAIPYCAPICIHSQEIK